MRMASALVDYWMEQYEALRSMEYVNMNDDHVNFVIIYLIAAISMLALFLLANFYDTKLPASNNTNENAKNDADVGKDKDENKE